MFHPALKVGDGRLGRAEVREDLGKAYVGIILKMMVFSTSCNF